MLNYRLRFWVQILGIESPRFSPHLEVGCEGRCAPVLSGIFIRFGPSGLWREFEASRLRILQFWCTNATLQNIHDSSCRAAFALTLRCENSGKISSGGPT
jgi:hypothetical protein